MGFRFRRSVKLAPGVRLNIGKRGSSLTLGGRGASVNVGKRGVYGNVGLPGTGISYRERLDRQKKETIPQAQSSETQEMEGALRIEDDGTLTLLDKNNEPYSEELLKIAVQQNSARVLTLLETRLEEIKVEQQNMLRPDLNTPHPAQLDDLFISEPFFEPKPEEPQKKLPGFFEKLIFTQEKREKAYQEALHDYRIAVGLWRAAKANHEAQQEEIKQQHEKLFEGDIELSESRFEERLSSIVWPRETFVDFQLDGEILHADIDLPEIEDMPREDVKLLRREYRLEMIEKGPVKVRKDYMTHIHAIGFRVAGEAFNALPALKEVIVSGYSQRLSKATGNIEDEYLFSAKIPRSDWEKINFNRLDSVDPVYALEHFNIRRDMTVTGIFKPIEPFL